MSKHRDRQCKLSREAPSHSGSLGKGGRARRSDVVGRSSGVGQAGVVGVWWVAGQSGAYARGLDAGLPVFLTWDSRCSHFKQI